MQHRQHPRILTNVASAATVAIAAALIAVGAPAASAPAASAAPRVINVDGIITAFTPKTINVSAGEEVSICLTSTDIDHDLTIPTVNNFQVVAKTGPAVCKTLTVPTATGTHKLICSIPGHEAAGMVGSLVIAAAGSAVPAAPAAPGAGAAPQAGPVPAGGVQADLRPLVDLSQVSPLMLGAAVLIAAMMCVLLGWVVARKT
jgi:uncharacterized cupredoxin-like copper-binding protein